MPTRRTSRLVATLVAACALLLALPAPAGAHAYLVRTDPGDGATLQHSPHRLQTPVFGEVC